MIKAALKSALAAGVYYSGLLSLVSRAGQGRESAIILMYHRVLPSDSGPIAGKGWMRFRSLPGIVVSPEFFALQLEYLSQNFNVIALGQLLDGLDKSESLPERAIVITFDDGWRDNFDYAFPILKKYKLPATIFLTTEYIDSTRVFWPERIIGMFMSESTGFGTKLPDDLPNLLAPFRRLLESIMVAPIEKRIQPLDQLVSEIKRLEPSDRERLLAALESVATPDPNGERAERIMLSWQEIAEMQAGGVSFGSHGLSHELFTMIDQDQLRRELSESKRLLESRLGTRVDTLAYPNGDYDTEVQRLAALAGYRCAVSVRKAHVTVASDRYCLGRINIHDGCCRGIWGGFSRARFASHIQRFPR